MKRKSARMIGAMIGKTAAEVNKLLNEKGYLSGAPGNWSMFNLKSADTRVCDSGSTIWRGEFSYIRSVKWSEFTANTEALIDAAYARQKDIGDYDIHVNLS